MIPGFLQNAGVLVALDLRIHARELPLEAAVEHFNQLGGRACVDGGNLHNILLCAIIHDTYKWV